MKWQDREEVDRVEFESWLPSSNLGEMNRKVAAFMHSSLTLRQIGEQVGLSVEQTRRHLYNAARVFKQRHYRAEMAQRRADQKAQEALEREMRKNLGPATLIEDMDLSTRTKRKLGRYTIGEVAAMSDRDILRFNELGERSLSEIREAQRRILGA